MELECVKYKEKMSPENAVCRHPADYCKYRTSCLIHFLGRENETSARRGQDNADKDTGTGLPDEMIKLNFAKSDDKILPAIVQDHQTGEILMLAYINEQSWRMTLATGKAHYWSRSRNKLWLKGESSGHVQLIREIRVDCDEDAVVFKVEQLGGAACHKGYGSCFFRRVEGETLVITEERVFDPKKVYK